MAASHVTWGHHTSRKCDGLRFETQKKTCLTHLFFWQGNLGLIRTRVCRIIGSWTPLDYNSVASDLIFFFWLVSRYSNSLPNALLAACTSHWPGNPFQGRARKGTRFLATWQRNAAVQRPWYHRGSDRGHGRCGGVNDCSPWQARWFIVRRVHAPPPNQNMIQCGSHW
jgi:hypothetical protein